MLSPDDIRALDIELQVVYLALRLNYKKLLTEIKLFLDKWSPPLRPDWRRSWDMDGYVYTGWFSGTSLNRRQWWLLKESFIALIKLDMEGLRVSQYTLDSMMDDATCEIESYLYSRGKDI